MALSVSGMYRTLYALGLLTVILLWTFWRAGVESTTSLSPQGCGMSYMSPSYLPQTAFDATWTPLARRYSLLLYRETGWQDDTPSGLPVLFIPGNAGSAHQIRSVASNAARTYYEKPGTVAKGMTNIRPLDFFSFEHNEDLSALHGPTLEAEAAYAGRALHYIASLYPKDTPIILMGHSMGGVVAASLLAPNTTNATISALVTLSAPHTLPPARLDRRIAKFYATARAGLEHSPVPIVSICGGATDGMVHSEACVLPPLASDNADAYRRTIFASALEGAWTGMGHQVSVWCDHVRRLVARALLNSAPLATSADRAIALSAALPDGFSRAETTYKPGKALNFQRNKKSKDFYPPTLQLALGSFAWNGIFMMPAPFQPGSLFTMYIGGGKAQGVGPEEKNTKLTGSVHACRQVSGDKPQGHECWPVTAKRIRRIPYVHANVSWPRLEGQAAFEEESEGEGEGKKGEGRKGEAGVRTGKDGWKDEITVWEADVPMPEDDAPLWVAVETDGADGKGWLVAGSAEAYVSHVSYSYGVHDLLHSPALIRLDPASMRTEVTLPRLTPSPLLVYRATPLWDNYTLCATARIPPTLEHVSPSASEAHWHPLIHADPHSPAYRPILLHSHAGAPFFEIPAPSVKNNESTTEGTQFTIYSTGPHAEGKCELKGLSLSLDWRASAGRTATRYWPALPAWALGVALWVFGMHWAASSTSASASTLPGAPLPTPKQTLHRFVTRHLPVLMFVAYIAAHFNLAPEYLLGNSGRSALAPLAPLMLFLAAGTTVVVYALLHVLLYLPTLFYRAKLRASGADAEKDRDEEEGVDIRKRAAAIVVVIVAVGTVVPWQAALAGAWVWHLFTTARSAAHLAARGGADSTPPEYERVALMERDDMMLNNGHTDRGHVSLARQAQNALAEHQHLLLFLTFLLPFAGPGLAVWKHVGLKEAMAGAGDAFRGDHAVWSVVPFVVAVEWAGRRRRGGVFEPTRIHIPGPVPLTSAHAFHAAALVACARGAYAGYAAPEASSVALAFGLVCRVGVRWWRDTRTRRPGLGEKPV